MKSDGWGQRMCHYGTPVPVSTVKVAVFAYAELSTALVSMITHHQTVSPAGKLLSDEGSDYFLDLNVRKSGEDLLGVGPQKTVSTRNIKGKNGQVAFFSYFLFFFLFFSNRVLVAFLF